MKSQNSVSHKILILHKINKKGVFQQICQASEKYVNFYALCNTWLGLLLHELLHQWHGGNQPVALPRCNGSPGCLDSGLQVICIVGSGVSHLPLDNTL